MKKIILTLVSTLLFSEITLADRGGDDRERMYLNDKMLYGEQFQRDGSYPVDYGYPRDQNADYQQYQGYPAQSPGYAPNQGQSQGGYNYYPTNQGYYYWNQDTNNNQRKSLKDSSDGYPRYPGPQGPTQRHFGFYTYNRPEAYQQYPQTQQQAYAAPQQQYYGSQQQYYAPQQQSQQQSYATSQQSYGSQRQFYALQQQPGYASAEQQQAYSSYPEPFRVPRPANNGQIADAENYVTPLNPPAQTNPLSEPSDAQLLSQIRMSFANGGSRYNDISVNVVNGIVKLDGMVGTDQERKDIEIQVYKVPGVKSIQDNIQLRGNSY